MTPFNITIEITEATQCHHAVSQLLRVFPKLRLTITVQDETIPTPSGAPQTCNVSDRCGHCHKCRAIVRAIDTIRDLSYLKSLGRHPCRTCEAAGPGGMGADEARQATREYSETLPRSEIERLTAAETLDRRDDNADPGYDDTNSNGR